MQPVRSAYFHIPFCRHRCGYCNFTLIADRADLVPDYLKALEKELNSSLTEIVELDTLFLGGGTPSFLSREQLRSMLDLLRGSFELHESAEFSCEVNPLDCSKNKLQLLRDAGVNRISIGGQSFSERKLKLLERDHSPEQLTTTVRTCQEFFDRVSLDLIFAAPGETLEEWQRDLDIATSLGINHLSTYGLTIEKGSYFYGRVQKGEILELDDDLQCTLYEHTINSLEEKGWTHYEVSSFADNRGQTSQQCRHNEAYWLGKFWWGFGPGAASFLPLPESSTMKLTSPVPPDAIAQRCVNHQSTTSYIRKLLHGKHSGGETDFITREQHIRERLVFGLRRLKGVNIKALASEFEISRSDYFEPTLSNYKDHGWLNEDPNGTLTLTRKGLLISDSLWPELLSQ